MIIDLADIADRYDGSGHVKITDAECEVLMVIARDYLDLFWTEWTPPTSPSLVIGEHKITDTSDKSCLIRINALLAKRRSARESLNSFFFQISPLRITRTIAETEGEE